MMLGHGFSLALTASLILAGFATDHVPNRGRRGPVARVRITDAGRRLLSTSVVDSQNVTQAVKKVQRAPPVGRERVDAARSEVEHDENNGKDVSHTALLD